MIDNLNVKCNIPFLIPEQYNDAMSYQELLYSILNAVNNCIDVVNKLPDDVREEVNKQLSAMISDGTLADLINDTIFNELNNKINDLSEKTTNNTPTKHPMTAYEIIATLLNIFSVFFLCLCLYFSIIPYHLAVFLLLQIYYK